jgi:hypothetical protein
MRLTLCLFALLRALANLLQHNPAPVAQVDRATAF